VRLITTAELNDLGFNRYDIQRLERHGILTRRHRGIYVIGEDPLTFDLQCKAALLASPNTSLAHHTATAHWLMRPTRNGPIHLTLPGRGGREKRPGIIIHRPRSLPPTDLTTLDNFPITTPTRTLLDVAPALPRYARFRALEAAEFHRLDIERDRLNASKPLRQPLALFDRLGQCTRSDAEAMFLFLCLDYGIPLPQVNKVIHDEEFDFRWEDARLIIEVDGFEFHEGDERRPRVENDRDKGLVAESLGYAFLRFSAKQVKRERERLARILHGRLRPNRSWASTHSSATTAEPSDSSPQSTVAATISANLRTFPLP
jgi:hypothetical protein